MNLTATPPAGWDDCIAFPLQSLGFADAALALGRPGPDRALPRADVPFAETLVDVPVNA